MKRAAFNCTTLLVPFGVINIFNKTMMLANLCSIVVQNVGLHACLHAEPSCFAEETEDTAEAEEAARRNMLGMALPVTD